MQSISLKAIVSIESSNSRCLWLLQILCPVSLDIYDISLCNWKNLSADRLRKKRFADIFYFRVLGTSGSGHNPLQHFCLEIWRQLGLQKSGLHRGS